MDTKLTLSQQVAEIGAGLKFEDLPDRVVKNSKMFIMDLLGNIIASRHVDSSLTCLKAARELGDGDPVSTAIGCSYKTTPQMAAMINGTFGHAFDMDDDHRYGTQHSSVVVFPAILALAEKYGKSGKDVITAFAYGSEITIRLGEAFEGQTFCVHHFYDPSLIFPSLQHIPHPLLPILSSLHEKVCQEADFFDRLKPTYFKVCGRFRLFCWTFCHVNAIIN